MGPVGDFLESKNKRIPRKLIAGWKVIRSPFEMVVTYVNLCYGRVI